MLSFEVTLKTIIKEINNENGLCITVNNMDMTPNSLKQPENVSLILHIFPQPY